MATIKGGGGLRGRLNKIAEGVGNGGEVKVGFMAGSTYPDGTSTPMVASVMEFGGSIDHPGGTKFIRDAIVGKGNKAKFVGTRFVGSDFSGEAEVTGPHKIIIPPRPFFRNMIAKEGPGWPAKIAKVLKARGYHVEETLQAMGAGIKGQLQKSIRDLVSPPLAPSTVRRKGFDKPLIDTSHMLNSVDYTVEKAE